MNRMGSQNAAAKERVMAVGNDARLSMHCQISPEPNFLGRVLRAATKHFRGTVRVQHHNMPASQIVTVISLCRITSALAPILKIAWGTGTVVFVVAGGGHGAILEPAPGGPVAVSKFLKCSLVVGEIACCKDGSRDLFDEFRGRFGAQEISAPGDVPCSDQREFFPTTVHAGLWRALRFRARLLPKSCSS